MICPTCNGNNKDMPCAYPSENKPGCLKITNQTIKIGDYTITIKDDLTISIYMDDGEGGDFELSEFMAVIDEFYGDNF